MQGCGAREPGLEHDEEEGQEEEVELCYDFQKAYDNVNNAFMEELLDVYGFPFGIQKLIVEMLALLKRNLSYWVKKEVGVVRQENGIIQGDAFSPMLFVLMIIDQLIKIVEGMVGE